MCNKFILFVSSQYVTLTYMLMTLLLLEVEAHSPNIIFSGNLFGNFIDLKTLNCPYLLLLMHKTCRPNI